ncbi:MAG: hypothetical protein ACI4VC_00100 [Clostridia bacterium]
MDSSKLMYIAISAVCVISIISAVFIQFDLKIGTSKEQKESNGTTIEEKTQEELKKDFANLFNNVVDFNDYDTSKIKKINDTKEIVYTVYESQATEENKYELDVHIPVININGDVVTGFNNVTQKLFANKTTEILEGVKNYTIYSIDYTGFINNDILSVIIRSTLKEGSNAQRTIVETYNYNLVTEKEVSIYDALEQREKTTNDLTAKINTEITQAIKEANKIQLTGFETYRRDINSDVYQIENISTFFIGPDEKLYVVFAYGNNNFTSEMDIIII